MKQDQLIFDYSEGKRLADEGLERAVAHAEFDYPGWREKVWNLFKRWISKKEKGYSFMMESFRKDCIDWEMVETPPSQTAFGFVTKRAKKEGLVKQEGTGQCRSVGSHSANAAMLVKV